ncbi:MAG: hypothetical protein IPN94_17995, partial [Sphingobacteriales bacterium]|nr:hypothetical protein [Sphingobacteriales bacterium]
MAGKATDGKVNLSYDAHIRKIVWLYLLDATNFMMSALMDRTARRKGWNRSIDTNHTPNIALGGGDDNYEAVKALDGTTTRTPDYRRDGNNTLPTSNNDLLFYNYKTNIREGAISGILSLHNIRFHKQQTKISLYGLAGIGWFVAIIAMMNQLDEDGA